AALEGLRFSPAPDGPAQVVLSLAARSDGALPVQASVNLTDGVFTVTNTADSGPGSLRRAIFDADATSGPVTIAFDLPATGAATIAPIAPLPPITNSVLIDGFSQPGYAGTPLVELNGSQAGTSDGLTISGSGTIVRGLMIDGFAQGAG